MGAVPDSANPGGTDDNFEGLGTIDVLILRCCANPHDKVHANDYDSGAESDVLHNTLTEDEPTPESEKPAGNSKGKDQDKDNGEKRGDGASDGDGDSDKPAKNTNVDGKGKTEKRDEPQESTQQDKANGQATKKGKKGKSANDGKGGKSAPVKQDKKQGKPKQAAVTDAVSDSDNDLTSIAGLDGPADDYYRRDHLYHDSRWPEYTQSNRYGYPNAPSNIPPPQQAKHVHWDMGSGQAVPPGPPGNRYSDAFDTPHIRSHHTPGLSQGAAYGPHQVPDNPYTPHYPAQPPTYTNYPEVGPQYHDPLTPMHSAPGRGPPLPGPSHYQSHPLHYPSQAPAHGHGHASRYSPQVGYPTGYPAWYRPDPNHQGSAGGQPQDAASQPQTAPQEVGGWKYVEPERKAEDLPTITKFNGWEFDKDKNTWIPAQQSASEPTNDNTNTKNDSEWKDQGDNTNNAGDNDKKDGDTQQSTDTWNNPTNDTPTDFTNHEVPATGDTASTSDNKTDENWNNDDDKNNDNGNNQSGGTTDEAWNTSSDPVAEDTGNDTITAQRTLHGPFGAYHGPKIAVEPDTKVPWIADEPPRYDLPQSIVRKLGLSKQVQRGKGYNYYKKYRKPVYIDSISEPYARFVFKYRTRDKLPRGLDKTETMEPSPDSIVQMLQDKKKEDLIAELQRWRMAYGDKAPEPPMLPTRSSTTEPDHAAWNLDPPKRDFLKYSLPGQFPDEPTASAANGGNNWNNDSTGGTTTDKPADNNEWANGGTTTSTTPATTPGNIGGGGGGDWDSQPTVRSS